MSRTLTLLFRRDRARDRQQDRIRYLGLRPLWPDGRPVTVGLDAFCQHGQRLFGLNRLLARDPECLIRMMLFPVADKDDRIHRLPGFRVRRFILRREGGLGRIHFMNGDPTDIVFDVNDDEPRVLNWIGMDQVVDGGELWFDFAACPVENSSIQRHGQRSINSHRKEEEESQEFELANV